MFGAEFTCFELVVKPTSFPYELFLCHLLSNVSLLYFLTFLKGSVCPLFGSNYPLGRTIFVRQYLNWW